ncbi:MAG: hypothetical protein AMXMBFR59_40080 [Rhodanobacteraceae bacterium]
MPMTSCKACSTALSCKATACPQCGHPNKEANYLSGRQVLSGLIVGGAAIWWFASGGFDKRVEANLSKIEAHVATDAVSQYEIAKRQGDPIQICVQAGFVSAAYLQAKDEAKYRAWKRTESEDCEHAGIPQ